MRNKNLTDLPDGILLTVLKEERRPLKNGKHSIVWAFCRCECGAEKWIRRVSIAGGKTKSCGCFGRAIIGKRTTTHGLTKNDEPRLRMYGVWAAMRQRCNNEKDREYPDYGGRGIKVCEEWESFENFRTHILSLVPEGCGDIPKGLSIDRFPDMNGDYKPGNIRLATSIQQCRNTRRNRMITVGNVTRCVSEWAEIQGFSPKIIFDRIKSGWSEADAVSHPKAKGKK
jgi:hypothetical protein